jgi:hypothetical protein
MSNISTQIDQIASEIEQIDPRIALALDKISDHLDRKGAIGDFIDLEEHKKNREKYPEITHTMETMEQLKKSLEDPKVEKKVRDYIEKNHKLEVEDLYLYSGNKGQGKEQLEDNLITVYIKFKNMKNIYPEFFKEHDLKYFTAMGAHLYSASIPVPLATFKV